jgi:AraC-like DNA-binding protein
VSPEPAAVAAAIRTALAGLPALRPRWVRAVPGSGPPPTLPRRRRPRITIVAAGERRVLAPVDGVVAEHRLRPGDALIVADGAWSIPLPDWQAPIIAINTADHGTRFEAPDRSFAGGRPLSAPAWSLLSALVALGGEPHLRRHAPELLRVFVGVACDDCREPAGGDRARRDWAGIRTYAFDHPGLGRSALAAAAGLHPNHLSRLCRRMEGMPLLAWLTRLRMERAKDLLRSGMALEAVIAVCGASDPSHFRRTFRRIVGATPGEFQRPGG